MIQNLDNMSFLLRNAILGSILAPIAAGQPPSKFLGERIAFPAESEVVGCPANRSPRQVRLLRLCADCPIYRVVRIADFHRPV